MNFAGIFLGLFMLIGLGLLFFAGRSAWRSVEAGSWPTTQGTLERAEVVTTASDDGSSHKVEVEYAYEVHGVAYRGSRLAFGYAGSNRHAMHQEICDKLQQASSVVVRYDPADPASSVLSYGLHASIRFLLVFAIVWLAFTGGMVLMWWMSSGSDRVLLENLGVE